MFVILQLIKVYISCGNQFPCLYNINTCLKMGGLDSLTSKVLSRSGIGFL